MENEMTVEQMFEKCVKDMDGLVRELANLNTEMRRISYQLKELVSIQKKIEARGRK